MIFLVLVSIVCVGIARWVMFSIKAVPTNAVARKRFLAKLQPGIYTSGGIFIPFVPVRFGGYHLWDFVIIPTDMFELRYEFNEAHLDKKHELYSKDHQPVFPQGTLFIIFPYKEEASLDKILTKNIPLNEAGLTKWAEGKVIPALWQVLKEFSVLELTGGVDLEVISQRVTAILRKENGVFHTAGITGVNPANTTEGTGYVSFELKQVGTTEAFREALAAPAIERQKADAANQTARMNAEEIGGQVLGIVARQHGMTIQKLEDDLEKHPEKAGQPGAQGGYKESFLFAQDMVKRDRAAGKGNLQEIRVGTPDGSPMPNLQMVGGGGGFMMGGGKQGNRGDISYLPKPLSEMTDSEKRDFARQWKENKGRQKND